MNTAVDDQRISPTRLLEMLSDRSGAFEAVANSSIELARVAPEEVVAMDVRWRRPFSNSSMTCARPAELRASVVSAHPREVRPSSCH